MQDKNVKQHNIKKKLEHEIQLYFTYAFFLALLFFAFSSYEHILLEKMHESFLPYSFCIIQALIMAKVILIGESVKLGEIFEDKQLVIPVLYKTIVFCLLMFVFTILEHIIVGYIHGRNIYTVYQEFVARGLNIAFAKILIMFFVFIFFFAVLETSRALGGNELLNLFFKPRPK